MLAAIRTYVDVISPYAYLGWRRVHELAARHGRTVEPVAVLFAAMLDAHGGKGPAEIEPKRIYTFKHVVRLAHGYGIPIAPPPHHPFNPLLALRVASLPLAMDERIAVVDALFDGTWASGRGVETAADVVAALDARGLPGAELVAQAATPAAKAALRTHTGAAIARGVFGVPTFDVDGELFWGQDALPHVEWCLRGEDPAAPLAAHLAAIRPSARRPGSVG